MERKLRVAPLTLDAAAVTRFADVAERLVQTVAIAIAPPGDTGG